jgi:RecA-family ATPase
MSLPHQRFLINNVWPAEEVHLIGGPSGSGKTRFIFQLILKWSRGEPFHKHDCHPMPFAYVSCDRSLDSVKRTLDNLSIPLDSFPMFSDVDDKLNNLECIINKIRTLQPTTEVIFIDGFISLLPGGKINDYGVVSNWLKDLNRLCKRLHITIIGIVHTTKTKEGEAYLNPREQIIGSTAFAGFADAIIVLRPIDVEETTTKRRRLYILSRTGAAEQFDYEFNDKGEIHPVESLPPDEPGIRARSYILNLPQGSVFTYEEVVGLGKISRAQTFRILGDLQRKGFIERVGKGEYTTLKESSSRTPLTLTFDVN